MKRKPDYKSASHYEDLRGWVQDALKRSGHYGSDEEREKRERLEKARKAGFDFDFEDIYERP